MCNKITRNNQNDWLIFDYQQRIVHWCQSGSFSINRLRLYRLVMAILKIRKPKYKNRYGPRKYRMTKLNAIEEMEALKSIIEEKIQDDGEVEEDQEVVIAWNNLRKTNRGCRWSDRWKEILPRKREDDSMVGRGGENSSKAKDENIRKWMREVGQRWTDRNM